MTELNERAAAQPEGDEVERVARAIYQASPAIWHETREPTTETGTRYVRVTRPVPWDEVVANAQTVSHEAAAVNEARSRARAAISAMRPAGVAEMVEALGDLVSWFTEPVIDKRVWLIPAGERGADDAVANVRALVARFKDPNQ
jgi:hypothetical protein